MASDLAAMKLKPHTEHTIRASRSNAAGTGKVEAFAQNVESRAYVSIERSAGMAWGRPQNTEPPMPPLDPHNIAELVIELIIAMVRIFFPMLPPNPIKDVIIEAIVAAVRLILSWWW